MSGRRAMGLLACAAGAVLTSWGVGRLLYARFEASRPLDLGDYWPLWLFPPLLSVGIYLALRPTDEDRPRADLRPVDEHWSEARPRYPNRERLVLAALIAIAYTAFAVPASLHYLTSHAVARRAPGVALAVLALLPAAALCTVAARRGLVLLRVRDARLLVNARAIAPGQEVQVKFVQQYVHRTHVDRARVGLVCTRRDARGRRPAAAPGAHANPCAFEAWKDLPVEREVAGGKRLRVSGRFHLPPEVPPTSPPRATPRCDWRFVLRMKLAHGPAYEAEFPVLVVPSHHHGMDLAVRPGEY